MLLWFIIYALWFNITLTVICWIYWKLMKCPAGMAFLPMDLLTFIEQSLSQLDFMAATMSSIIHRRCPDCWQQNPKNYHFRSGRISRKWFHKMSKACQVSSNINQIHFHFVHIIGGVTCYDLVFWDKESTVTWSRWTLDTGASRNYIRTHRRPTSMTVKRKSKRKYTFKNNMIEIKWGFIPRLDVSKFITYFDFNLYPNAMEILCISLRHVPIFKTIN